MAHMSSWPATVRQLPTAADWLAATKALRAIHPVLMNVAGSVAEDVAAGTRYDSELWLVVEEAATVVGCALRTAPHPALLSPMRDEDALALGRWLATYAPSSGSLTGPAEVVNQVAIGMGRTTTIRMREVIRVLGGLRAPAPCAGSLRAASVEDLGLLRRWFANFHSEACLIVAPREDRIRASIDEGRLFLWETDLPVAMAGHATIVATPGGRVGRIGPVYTLPERRRQGYGAAVTHAVATLLSGRCDQVMLFADADNPASNSVYARLGFTVAAELVEADLGEA